MASDRQADPPARNSLMAPPGRAARLSETG